MRIFINRQDDTTNSQVPNARIETGWGVMAVSSTTNLFSETVTFQTPFTNKPIVHITFGGDNTTNGGYGSGGSIIEGSVNVKAYAITNTSFIAYARKPDGSNYAANGFLWYQWIAIGA